jgi:hypothetical protein
MAYFVQKNRLIFFLLCGAACLIGVIGPLILPSRFFTDAYTIKYERVEEGLLGSYEFATLLYNKTGLASLPFSVVGLIQLPMLMYILYRLGIPKNFHMLTLKNSVVYLGILIVAIYTCMPSKEFITYVYVAGVLWLFRSKKTGYVATIILSSMLMFFFGVFFRPYFMIIPLLALGMYVFTFVKMKNKKVQIFMYGFLIVIFMSFSYGFIKGEFLTQGTRDFVNADRSNGLDSNSIIVSPVKADTWYGEIISILYGFFSVNLPFNGFKHILKPQILAFVIWQLLLFWILFVRFSWALKDRAKYRYELWALLLLFAYFIVQGVFEPDLGSAVKHKMGMFPLIYYCLYYENSRPRIQQDI